MRKYLSPRQTARLPECPVSEGFLRRLIHQRRCPGFYSGTHFLINVDALIEQLESLSRATGEVANHERN